MAGEFTTRKEIEKGFQKTPPRVFQKRGTIANIIKILQGQKPPFKKYSGGGAVNKKKGGPILMSPRKQMACGGKVHK